MGAAAVVAADHRGRAQPRHPHRERRRAAATGRTGTASSTSGGWCWPGGSAVGADRRRRGQRARRTTSSGCRAAPSTTSGTWATSSRCGWPWRCRRPCTTSARASSAASPTTARGSGAPDPADRLVGLTLADACTATCAGRAGGGATTSRIVGAVASRWRSGAGSAAIALLLLALFFGVDPSVVLQGGGSAGSGDRGARQLPGRRPAARLRRRGPRRHGGRLARDLRAHEPRVPRPDARAVHAARSSRRAASPARPSGRSTVRPTTRSTSTSSFFRDLRDRFRAPGRLRAGLRHRARGRPPRAERCSARRARARRAAAAATAPRPTRSRCGWSCRPTAWPASGRHHAQNDRARSSSRATSTRRCGPPRRSATTACSGRRRAR